jgi:ribosomal subunit interface protein
VTEALGKYFDGGYAGHVTVERDGFSFRTECVLHLDSGAVLHAEANDTDAYASADQAASRLERRLSRYKRRLKDRPNDRKGERQGAPRRAEGGTATEAEVPSYVIETPAAGAEDDIDAFSPTIIAESTTTLRLLSVSEAVIELDLTGAPFLLFRHAGNGRVNLVYRRHDGHIGWIDPPGPQFSDH